MVKLGQLEHRVMMVLWDTTSSDLTCREVGHELPGYAYTTIATVLERLVGKGLVDRRLEGRTVRFAPSGSKSEHAAILLHEALRSTDDPAAALAEFAGSMTTEEAEALRQAAVAVLAREG